MPGRLARAPRLDLLAALVSRPEQEQARSLELGAREVVALHRLGNLRELLVPPVLAIRVLRASFRRRIEKDRRAPALEALDVVRDVDLFLPEERLEDLVASAGPGSPG